MKARSRQWRGMSNNTKYIICVPNHPTYTRYKPNFDEVLLLFACCIASVRITSVFCITSVCATVLWAVFRNYCVLVYVEETSAHHYMEQLRAIFHSRQMLGGISAENWRIFTSCARTQVAATPQPAFKGAVSRELVFSVLYLKHLSWWHNRHYRKCRQKCNGPQTTFVECRAWLPSWPA
jgi:hypothetical protein